MLHFTPVANSFVCRPANAGEYGIQPARHLDCNKSDQFADAHIFTARQAKAIGLIDDVATIDKAKDALKKAAHIKKAVWKKPSPLETIFGQLSEQSVSKVVSILFGLKAYWAISTQFF